MKKQRGRLLVPNFPGTESPPHCFRQCFSLNPYGPCLELFIQTTFCGKLPQTQKANVIAKTLPKLALGGNRFFFFTCNS